MTNRLYYASTDHPSEAIEELSVVSLCKGMQIDPAGYLPAGSLGAVVFVHDKGNAYEVEFTAPFDALVTLRSDEFTLVDGATREHFTAASNNVLHKHSKN